MNSIRFAPLSPDTWPDFETLFEAPGAPKFCWCMAWRFMPDKKGASSADKKEAMHALVKDRLPVGILAYENDVAVGWCSVAPRETYYRVAAVKEPLPGTWSIACFFVPKARRGSGLAGALLDAAVEHAFASGAEAVEGYPVDPESHSYRFMGFRPMFEKRDFEKVGMAGKRRHVMRLRRG